MAFNDLNVTVEGFMRRDLVSLPNSASILEAARMMKKRSVGSVLVTETDMPIGIVTERDLVNKVIAEGKNPEKITLKEIMSFPLIYVSPTTIVREALSIMAKNRVRRLLIKDGEKFLGMISQRAYVGDRTAASIPTLELEPPKGIICPYCKISLPNSDKYGRHLDEHIRQDAINEKRDAVKIRRRLGRHDL